MVWQIGALSRFRPNGPAYQHTETRSGPPLEYVADKLDESLRVLHRLHSIAVVIAAREGSEATQGTGRSVSDLVYESHTALHLACVSYLALQNMIAHANPPSFVERLLALDRREFARWIDDMTRGGSVS